MDHRRRLWLARRTCTAARHIADLARPALNHLPCGIVRSRPPRCDRGRPCRAAGLGGSLLAAPDADLARRSPGAVRKFCKNENQIWATPGYRRIPCRLAARLANEVGSARELPRSLSQVGIDARLPSAAGLAIGRQHIMVETKFDGLFRMRKRWSAALDDPVAVANFRTSSIAFVSSGASSYSTFVMR